jgi:hypothetical protein
METGVEVGAAVLNDRQTEIGVGCFEQSGEDNAASGDAVENQRVNVIGAEDHGEVGAGEGTDAMLGDDNFAFFRRDDSRDSSERVLKQFLMLRRGLTAPKRTFRELTSGSPGRKPTWTWMTIMPVARAWLRTLAARVRKASLSSLL